MSLLHGLGLFEEGLDKVINKTKKYKCEVGQELCIHEGIDNLDAVSNF